MIRKTTVDVHQVICPVDYQRSGVISDDVKRLPFFNQRIRLIRSSGNTRNLGQYLDAKTGPWYFTWYFK